MYGYSTHTSVATAMDPTVVGRIFVDGDEYNKYDENYYVINGKLCM